MRMLFQPVKNIFDPPKPKPAPVVTPKEDEEAARKATEEAERKARSLLAAQRAGGRQSTIFGAARATQAGIQSKRPTVLGV